ncbi:MAG: CinA family nicotinamide mononucleotide deamidase-related protein, partial [Acidobacteria bacterium]|nr:CinA family nicotinamide mononucleotide deamidase-related protein [Acidobacteriota bacterium]
MRAAFLAVGSELLGTDRLDTNSLKLTAVLARYGVELRRKAVVGDSVEDVARELRSMIDTVPLVLVSGGLGPTADDVTREAAAVAVGRGLHEDAAVIADIEEKFRRFGRTMAAVNRRQAQVIDGAEVLWNRWGTAPALRLEEAGTTVFFLPGVPRELEGLTEVYVIPWLEEHTEGVSRETRVLKVAGLPESELEELIAPAYGEFGRESVTVLAKPAEITIQVTAVGSAEERRHRLEAMQTRLAELVGSAVYSLEDEPLEAVVGRLLVERGETLATAESCTGGLIAERLTRIAGSSDYFEGGVVVYSNRLKQQLLGVPEDVLEREGAVSEAVARALAEGVRDHLGTTWGLGVTGIAGPGGGS